MTTTATGRLPATRRTHFAADVELRFGRLPAMLLTWLLKPRTPMGPYGVELIVDLDVHDLDVIGDAEQLKAFTAALIEHIDMKAYGPVWIKHFGHASDVTAGYTVIQPIETSSVVIHLSEGNLTAHLNVFSCQAFNHVAALQFIEQWFKNWRTTYTVINR
jgi:hypothetical protein